MLFTRTIRRKMVVGLALVLVMLITLSLSAISGLNSYHNVIREFDFNINQAPRRSELSAAIGLLFEPLLLPDPKTAEAARSQQREFEDQLELSRAEFVKFHHKLRDLPPTPAVLARRPITEGLLQKVYKQLDELDRLHKSLGNSQSRSGVVHTMLRHMGNLEALIQDENLDYQDGLNNTLQHADSVYLSRFQLIGWTSAVVIILFLGLMGYGHISIFAPLRRLHQGALRVAQGDFDYRLELTSHDEMAELANSFNKMTARFQEITQDLDRQVRERSKQLVRSERLAGIGFLAAGVAHEINNPLSAIAMAAESLQGRKAEPLTKADHEHAKIAFQYLDMIQREAFRCRQITDKLLDFSRGQDAPRCRNDLAAIISEVLSMVQHMSKFRDRKIEFPCSKPCNIDINGSEIKQVILNLIANALESMESGGTLRINLIEQTDQVVVSVEDDGCGMTPEVIENLFEPFFTRKKNGKGTGLGMSISHRIISDYGGTIEAFSEGPGCGSTFHVHLPRQAAGSDVAA